MAPSRADARFEVRSRGLRTAKVTDEVAAALDGANGLVAELAIDLVDRSRQINARINELERRNRTTPLSNRGASVVLRRLS